MKILVLGGGGYLGWPTALHLSATGHEVAVADNFARRSCDYEMGVDSLVPIESLQTRVGVWRQLTGKHVGAYIGDLCDADFTYQMVADYKPDAVVHYAEQRAAPYSMVDRKHAVYTQTNNVVGTLNVLYAIAELDPDIHLVKLGTMGEYRHTQYRHRGRVAARRALRPLRSRALPEAARLLLSPVSSAVWLSAYAATGDGMLQERTAADTASLQVVSDPPARIGQNWREGLADGRSAEVIGVPGLLERG